MKKLLKAIKNFFLSIWKFIDKRIVLPLTKLVLNLTGKFENPGKFLENWLSKRNTLLFISLALAVFVFIVIDQKIVTFSKNSAEVLRSIPVTAIYNEEAYVVEGLPETVDITLIGSKTDLFIAKQMSTYDVSIDLTGLKPGQHKVNIKYNQSLTDLEYMVNPSAATVIIYDKASQTKSLSVDILNKDKLDDKLIISETKISSDKVIVKGSEQKLEQVAAVKALLDVENLVKQEVGTFTVKDVPLRAYDINGDPVDVEIVPSKMDIEVTITSPSKEVPIKINPTGSVAFGKAITSLETDVSKIKVYGDQETLDALNYITVDVDVTDLKSNKEYKLDINKPVGVTSMSVNSVTVNITLGTVSERDITGIKVVTRNLPSGYSVTADDESNANVTVNLKGVASVIEGITSDDIIAFVDLSGLEPGTHDVEVQIEGSDPKVQYLSKTKKIRITISK